MSTVKTWQERMPDCNDGMYVHYRFTAMQEEINELRAMLSSAPPQPAQVQPLTDEQEIKAALFDLAISKRLLTVHIEHVANPRTDPKTKVSWMQGHLDACDISNDAARIAAPEVKA